MTKSLILSRTTLLSTLVLLIVPLAILALWPKLNGIAIRDAAPPDDTDLALLIPSASAEGNGLTLLGQAVAEVESADMSGGGPEDAGLLGSEGNPEAAKALLGRNERALALLDQAAAHTTFHFDPVQYPVAELAEIYSGARRLARIASFRAMTSFREGEALRSLEESLVLLRLGHRMQAAGGPLRLYTTGQEVKLWGLSAFQHALGRCQLGTAELVPMIAAIKQLVPDTEALAKSMRFEYWASVEMLQNRPALAELVKGDEWPDTLRKVMFEWGGEGKPNLTRARLAEDYRRLIRLSTENFREIPRQSFRAQSAPVWEAYLGGNASLEAVYPGLVPQVQEVYFRKAIEATAVSISLVLAAIKCHQADHGTPPELLEQLVPAYLDEMPNDGFVGRPLRYLPDMKIIYPWGIRMNFNGGDFGRQGETRILRVSFQ